MKPRRNSLPLFPRTHMWNGHFITRWKCWYIPYQSYPTLDKVALSGRLGTLVGVCVVGGVRMGGDPSRLVYPLHDRPPPCRSPRRTHAMPAAKLVACASKHWKPKCPWVSHSPSSAACLENFSKITVFGIPLGRSVDFQLEIPVTQCLFHPLGRILFRAPVSFFREYELA